MKIEFFRTVILAAVAVGVVTAGAFAAQQAATQATPGMTPRPVIVAQASKAQCTAQCATVRAACVTQKEDRYQSTAPCQTAYKQCVAKCR